MKRSNLIAATLLLLASGCKRPEGVAVGGADAGAVDAAMPLDAGAATITIAWTVDQSKARPPMTGAHVNLDPTTHSVPIEYTLTVGGTARPKKTYYANGAPPALDSVCSQVEFLNAAKNELWEVARATDGHGTVSSIDASPEAGEHRLTYDTFDLPAGASIRQDVDVIAPDGTHTAMSCTASSVALQRALTPSAAAAAGKCKMVAFDNTVLTLDGHTAKAAGANGTNVVEHYIALDVTQPLCGADGQPVRRVQLMSTDTAVSKSIDGFANKNVVVHGTAFAAMTAHHHQPILIDVKNIEAK